MVCLGGHLAEGAPEKLAVPVVEQVELACDVRGLYLRDQLFDRAVLLLFGEREPHRQRAGRGVERKGVAVRAAERFELPLGLAAAILVEGGQLFGVAFGVRDVNGLLRAGPKDRPPRAG